MVKKINVGKILGKSFEISLQNPELFSFLVPIIAGVILFIVGALLLVYSITPLHIQSVLIASIMIILSLLLIMSGVGATILYAGKLIERRKVGVWQIMRHGMRESPRLSLAYFLEQLFIILGLSLLIIPGLIVAVRLALTTPACILEKKGLGIKKSWRTTKGNGWRIALLLLVWFLIFIIGGIIPVFIIVNMFLLPVYLVNLTLVYLQLKRK